MSTEFKLLKIVSGISGSGKSVALRALEDVGYYCVDNLPISLLSGFADEILRHSIVCAAVSVDSRNYQSINTLTEHLDYLDQLEMKYEFIYLDADDSTLMQRYGETRRVHPLMSDSVSLAEGISMERELLAPLLDKSFKHIDTTRLSLHGLRTLILEDAATSTSSTAEPALLFKSFAYKRGMPLDADFVFDVRCLPNPYWVMELRDYDGTQRVIADYFAKKPSVTEMVDQIDTFITRWLQPFRKTGRTYITVAIGCTGGQHRSVYVVERLAERFSERDVPIQKLHSELH